MKKILTLIVSSVIMLSTLVPVNAADKANWTTGNGYLVDGKPAPTTVVQTADGMQVTTGGYYTDGVNWGGLAMNEKVTLDGFSIEIRMDKLPDTDANDAWFGVNFLQKPQLFQVKNYADNKGISDLIRWTKPDVYLYGPTEFKALGNKSGAEFSLKEGDILKFSVKKKTDNKYYITVNGTELNFGYDLKGIADDGKAYLVISSSMKNSGVDSMVYTIMKVNGKTPQYMQRSAAPATADASSIAVILAVCALAGAAVVTAKKR